MVIEGSSRQLKRAMRSLEYAILLAGNALTPRKNSGMQIAISRARDLPMSFEAMFALHMEGEGN